MYVKYLEEYLTHDECNLRVCVDTHTHTQTHCAYEAPIIHTQLILLYYFWDEQS